VKEWIMTDDRQTFPLNFRDYESDRANDWCAGCGDHGILRALEKALAGLEMPLDEVAVFGGIGCSGKTPYYLNTFGIHTLHGRVLSFATGAKLANPELKVIAVGGDGDALSIGAGHFVNAGRRNLDMTYIMFNNGVYGLTKGQAAPTLRPGEQTKSMPKSNIQGEANPIMLALAAGYTWIGRGYAYDVAGLSSLIQEAISHPGIAFLDVLQPCPKYNDLHSREWYAERLYALNEDGHDPLIGPGSDPKLKQERQMQCLLRAQEWGERIPTGVFLQDLSVPDFGTLISQVQPSYSDTPPCNQPVADASGAPQVDLEPLLAELGV
jgi:2-oxoglutarate/2-oxoacid ferredoxin oxidoreductase subunit beta